MLLSVRADSESAGEPESGAPRAGRVVPDTRQCAATALQCQCRRNGAVPRLAAAPIQVVPSPSPHGQHELTVQPEILPVRFDRNRDQA